MQVHVVAPAAGRVEPVGVFTDGDAAARYERDLREGSGWAQRTVGELESPASDAPRWHVMSVVVDLEGTQRWRREHPWEGPLPLVPSSTWRVVPDAAGGPAVRIDVVGVDRRWCIQAARAAWQSAAVSEPVRAVRGGGRSVPAGGAPAARAR